MTMRMNRKRAILIFIPLVFFLALGGKYFYDKKNISSLIEMESREGWRILIETANTIGLLDIKTKSLIPVYAPKFPRPYHLGLPSFSPCGTKITFTEQHGRYGESLVMLDLQESKHEVLIRMRYLDSPRWSPNGIEIAFLGRLADRGNFSLYLLRLADKTQSILIEEEFEGGELLFTWSPSGNRLVYQDIEKNVVILDLLTKTRKKLDKGWFPTWSPNGKFIAYAIDGGPFLGYTIYDLDTEKKERILYGEPVYRSLIWSPDSRYVVYSKGGHGDYYGDLCVMELGDRKEGKVFSQVGTIFPTDWTRRVRGDKEKLQ